MSNMEIIVKQPEIFPIFVKLTDGLPDGIYGIPDGIPVGPHMGD